MTPAVRDLVILSVTRTLLSDTYSRADSAVSLGSTENGVPYVAQSGTWGVSSSQAYSPTASGVVTVAADARKNDVRLTCSIKLSSTANRAVAGVVVRDQDDANHLSCGLVKIGASGASDVISLGKRVAAVNTTLSEVQSAGLVNGQTYRFRLDAKGPLIQVYLDDVLKITHTLSAGDRAIFANWTKVGYRLNIGAGLDDGGSRLDNLLVERL